MLKGFTLKTNRRVEFVNITDNLDAIVRESGIQSGIMTIFVPHTTAGVTINENADPDVVYDITTFINKAIPFSNNYEHNEGNSAAHIKSSLFGPSLTIIIDEGEMVLGTWQGIYFCEFDGPRTREYYVKVIAG
ncbi:MAG: secondary thiamine-phosphate synthase enzyme YjbQ [Candidatus Wallbacteria bacterium]